MKCANCGSARDEHCVDGEFCSAECRAVFEHEEKLRENEQVSILVRGVDDGSVSVQLNLRQPSNVQEMARRFDSLEEALRGIATLCTSIADNLEKDEDPE